MANDPNLSLAAFFRPKGIAVVGASSDVSKPGNIILRHILAMGYKGNLFPINPREEKIISLPCYKTVLDAPGAVDLVVLLLPADAAIEVAHQIAERKNRVGDVSGVICMSAGFSELNTPGSIDRERKIVHTLRTAGIRLIGPNCMGVMDTESGINTNFDIATYPKGGVAIVTQSGAFGSSFLMWARGRSACGISKFVSLGNMADVDMIEVLDLLKEDAATRVIGMYLEGHPSPRRLIEVLRDVVGVKPVVVLKVGRTEVGSSAALSHTGAVAGSDAIYEGALKQAGVIRVRTVPEFYDTLRALEKQPVPRGNAVCVLTHIGGPGTICVDEISTLTELRLAEISPNGKESLRRFLAPTATLCKPEGYIDLTAAHYEKLHNDVLRILFSEEGVSMVIQIMAPSSFLSQARLAEEIVSAYRSQSPSREKPLLNVIMYGSSAEELRRILEKEGLPTFEFPDTAAHVAANMSRYGESMRMLQAQTPPMDSARTIASSAELREIFNGARTQGRSHLLEPEAYEICGTYGISTAPFKLVANLDEGLRAAEEIGYPVVLKVVSPDILHKTEVGGVVPGVETAQELTQKYDQLLKNVRQRAPGARLAGVLVQKKLPPTVEIAVGGLRDRQFGPVVMFGLGGIYVESLRQVAFRLCPLTTLEARGLIQETSASRLLQGVRGGAPADLDSLSRLLVLTGQLLNDHKTIEQLDFNPVLAYSQGYSVVDARFILSRDNEKSKTD